MARRLRLVQRDVLPDQHPDPDAGEVEAVEERVDLRELVEARQAPPRPLRSGTSRSGTSTFVVLAKELLLELGHAHRHHRDDVLVPLVDRPEQVGKGPLVVRVLHLRKPPQVGERADVPVSDLEDVGLGREAVRQVFELGDAVGEADWELVVEELGREEELFFCLLVGGFGVRERSEKGVRAASDEDAAAENDDDDGSSENLKLPLSLSLSLSLHSSATADLHSTTLTCLSSGTWPKVSMYLRLTPVCFFIAHEKTSATISLSTVSASLVAAAVAGRQAARSTEDAALAPSDISLTAGGERERARACAVDLKKKGRAVETSESQKKN